jgi:hypothetical protein
MQNESQLSRDRIGAVVGMIKNGQRFFASRLSPTKTWAVPEKSIILEIALSQAMGPSEDIVGE